MGNPQPFKFGSIAEFLDYIPEDERKIVEALRGIVHETIPDIKEKLSYNVPFFSRNRRICYIWPASVPWGNVKTAGVQFSFTQGAKIPDELGLLSFGNRKSVGSFHFQSLKEIDLPLLKAYLFEAVLVDDGFVGR